MPFKDPKSHREQNRIYQKRWRERYPEKARAIGMQYYYRHKEERDKKSNERCKLLLRKYRLECLTHYGDSPPKCACCGENHIEFLAIDHINGGGREDRKRFKTSHSFYRWLIKSDFPSGYRVLCHNCNQSLGYYGYCPHNPQHL